MKKISKVLGILLVVALIATLFIGAGAATFKQTSSDLSATGIVVPGQTVTAEVTFGFDVSNLSVGDKIVVETNFETPWDASIVVKGASETYETTVTNIRPTLDCINFKNLASAATVVVSCTGTIPSSARGKTIVPLKVSVSTLKPSNESGTAETASLEVYNTSGIGSDIVAISTKIATLIQRINTYNTPDVVVLNISFTVPEGYVQEAQTYISHAQQTGITDYTASRYVLEAQNKIAIAEKSVNDVILQVAKAKLSQVNSLIKDLEGLNIDVDNISTKYTVYEGKLSSFNSTTPTDQVDELIANIDALYNEAYAKMYPENPMADIPSWLPIVIVCAIGAIVAAIVVILVVRRHKKNSWDELG